MSHTYDQFFTAVLAKMGVTPFSAGTAAKRALATVSIFEGQNDYWNPLNITHPLGSGGAFNSAGVQKYGSFQEGVNATAAFLSGTTWVKWVKYGLAYSTATDLILRQFEVGYNSWGSHPDFYSIDTARRDARRAAIMRGPGG
jgi:hypothetical protein